MFFRLLLESFRRGRRAKMLALGAILLGTLSATALGALVLASGDRFARSLASYGANIRVLPAEGAETLPVDELAALDDVFWRNNLLAIAPLLELRVRFGDGRAEPVVAPVVGTWFAHDLARWTTGLPSTRPALPVEGRWPSDGAAEIAVGRRLAARLGAGSGDAVTLGLAGRTVELQVVGLVGGGGEEEDRAFAPLGRVQGLAGQGPDTGRITGAEIFALTVPEPTFQRKDPAAMSPEEYDAWYCTAYPSAVALSIEEGLPTGRADVVREVAGASGSVLLELRAVLLGLAAVTLLGAFLGVSSTMTATVQGRETELALLSALGSERGWIARFFLTEALVIGLTGGLLGGLGGLLAGRWLGGALFGMTGTSDAWVPALLPFAVTLGALVALAGALRPLARVLSTTPAAVLAGGGAVRGARP
jgi:putative ABC transport system permease protein